MNKESFNAEIRYQFMMTIARNLRKQGLLTDKEFDEIDTIMQADTGASLGTLLSENPLT